MANVIIIGKGPAGISAALYTRRAGMDTLILAKGSGALGKTDQIENYYGFAQPISGPELLDQGIQNALRLGCDIREDEVVGISYNGKYQVQAKNGVYEADAVILATGAQRNSPKIPGISELEGRGVSYCAVCDAFFYRNKNVAVLGGGEYAIHEALELLPTAASVTLLTDGKEPEVSVPEGIQIEKRKLISLEGERVLERICFDVGEPLAVAGVFIAVGVASSGDLAKKLGAQTEGNRIVVNERMETTLPGLYAAGDCTGGLLQIAKAVADGAVAGTETVKFLRKNTAK